MKFHIMTEFYRVMTFYSHRRIIERVSYGQTTDAKVGGILQFIWG